jgi:hypothetical protein
MNEYAFRHRERLHFAARKLARDIQAMRAEPTLPKLYRELYETLEARLSAVTQARRAFGRWLRLHPNARPANVAMALRKMAIPTTRPELREAIRAIRRKACENIRVADVRSSQP